MPEAAVVAARDLDELRSCGGAGSPGMPMRSIGAWR
jgi:hypothetical protein